MADYAAYPDHPLHGINPEILECARTVLRGAAQWHDVDAEQAEPIADAVVMALRENGYLNGYRDLLTAARQWRTEGLIPKTSTASWPSVEKLLAAIAAFDPEPCDHPKSWRVFFSQSADADQICGYCGAILVSGLTIPHLPEDPEGDAYESSYARHPSSSEFSSPPE